MNIISSFFESFFNSFFLACSFLTVLPFPNAAWTDRNLRCFVPALPLVGLVLGAFWFAALLLLELRGVSLLLKGVLMTLCALALTGGIHMDGWMDTCDALFSRKDRATRLRILSDPHSGAFAVMGCSAVLLLQSALFAELLAPKPRPVLLAASVPFWSRLGLGLLLNNLPFAKEDGMARTLGGARNPRHTLILGLEGLIAAAVLLPFVPLVPLTALIASFLLLFVLWQRCCLTVFGGITGDLLGAFAMISETTMLLVLLAAR
ncbi:MAG: adenosylcobinamide-GDP ribazoletransferase [Fretibacterium sp.]|nr:adenosylcobinamide-GDP ribazoletransferase [Fretibacterium sp.]